MAKKETNNIEKIKRYLLDDVPQDQKEMIEIDLIENSELEEKFILAEESLIEDFLEGELSEKDRELFNKNFLITEERQKQIQIIAQLKHYAKNAFLSESVASNEENGEPNFLRRIIEYFTVQPFRLAYGVVILGIVASLTWFTVLNPSNSLSTVEVEYAKVNQQDFSDSNKYKDFSKLILDKGVDRGDGNSKVIKKEKLTENVYFNVALRGKQKEGETFRVEIEKGNKKIFTLKEIRVYKNEVGEELRFLIPESELKKGFYQIKITSNLNTQNSLTFPFRIK